MILIKDPLILSLIVGILFLVFSYIWTPKILEFLKRKTFKAQETILMNMEKLMMSQNPSKMIRNCWILSSSLSALAFFAVWPNVILGLGLGIGTFLLSWEMLKRFTDSLWKAHCEKVASGLVEPLTVMCNGLKSGLGLSQVLDRVVKAYPGPACKRVSSGFEQGSARPKS